MIIPISTDRPLKRPTMVTFGLLAACAAVHLASALVHRFNPALHDTLFGPLVLNPNPGSIRWWAFFTYQFLHADFMHLLGNMLFLFVFGPAVEDRLGRWGYLAFYLVGGAAAGLAHTVFERPVQVGMASTLIPPVVGASGSIACVTGAYLVLFPLATIRVLVFFIIIGIYHFPAWVMIALAIAKDLWSSAGGWLGGGESRVAFAAHLGGYAYGAAIAFLLLALKMIPREPYDLFSMSRQAHRRRVFKELTSSGKSAWLSDAPTKLKTQPGGGADAERASAQRARIASELSSGNRDGAALAYLELLSIQPDAALSRNNHLDVANHLVTLRKHADAAAAYEAFIVRYPRDREATHVRLMLALISARYLNDPVRAKNLLGELRTAPCDDAQRRIADELARELG